MERPSRASVDIRFKHLYGTMAKRDLTFFNLSPNHSSSMDTPILAASADFWAVPWAGGGGPVFVGRHDAVGKHEREVPLLNAHKASVLTVEFSPLKSNLLAVGSDDCHLSLWTLPPDGVVASMGPEDATADLVGHSHGVRSAQFHPTTGILASASQNEVYLWDLEASQECLTASFGDLEIANTSFNYDGSLMAVAGKSSRILVHDPREGESVLTVPTDAVRSQRVVWCTNFGGSHSLLSVGTCAGGRGRQVTLWDARAVGEPLVAKKLDASSGQLFPIVDEGTGVALVSGRGDNTVRVFEMGPTCSQLTPCTDFRMGGEPVCGIAALPKQTCNVRAVETMKILRLTTSSVDPITFVLPRSDNLKAWFQDDVFPPARAPTEALPVQSWLAGNNVDPVLDILQPPDMLRLSDKPPEVVKKSKAQETRQQIAAQQDEDKQNDAVMARMRAMAEQRSKYHPNQSMGRRKGVDAEPIYDSDEEGWSDTSDT